MNASENIVRSDKSPSDALVIFGISGDLAAKKIFPALYAMVKRGVLAVPILGVPQGTGLRSNCAST